MTRLLIILGIALIVAGLAWPLLVKSGLGKLPGDIVLRREHVTFYFPVMTSLLLSILVSLVLWLARR